MQIEGLYFKDEVILNVMRDLYLKDLVAGCASNRHHLKESLACLNLNPYFTFPAVALLEPAGRFAEEHEKRRRAEKIRDYMQERICDGSVIFMDDEGRIGLLFSWVSKELLETIRSMLRERFPHPVNIGVGMPCSHLADVHTSYSQAAQALTNKFYRGMGQIIYYSEVDKFASLQDYPVAKEKELYECIKSAESAAEIERAVDGFYDSLLAGGPIDINNIYELTVRLLVGTEKRVLAEADRVGAYKRYEVMSIVHMETLQEIKAYVSEYFTGLRDVISQNEKESHRSIIKKTIQYMEQECQHATLYSVAQKVYMTPTYLSLLFKMNTGKTFIEQLTEIRIDKAKDMLKSTHLKNYEVAERVGYQDSRYFSQIFKKKVGVSPSEYREMIGK